jgi:hypothetical protein
MLARQIEQPPRGGDAMRWLISFLAVLVCGLTAGAASASTVMHSAWAKDDELDVTVKQTCPAEPVSLYYSIAFPGGRTIRSDVRFPDPCRPPFVRKVERPRLGLEWRFWTDDRAHQKGSPRLANRRFTGLFLKTEKQRVKVYLAVVHDGDTLIERWATLDPK